MALLVATFIFLAAIIVVAGLFLTKYADAIADVTGLGRTLAGLILLAAATSLPELAVDCAAVMKTPPAPDLAVGALVGSSLFNLLILAIMDLCHRRKERILSPASAEHALSAITTVILTAIVVVFTVLKGFPLSWMGFSLGPSMIFLAYIFCLRLIYIDQQQISSGTPEENEPSPYGTGQAVMGYLISTAVIFVAAGYLAPTADQIATDTGLGGTFVGSTFVALTTSLPEVVTTAMAIRMGAFNLAVGNVLGSNAFNMAILFPVDLVYRGSLFEDVANTHAITGGAVIVITGILCLSFFCRTKTRYWFMEPDAKLIIVLAISAIVALYFLSPAAGLVPIEEVIHDAVPSSPAME
ncbi:MAG: sodium:calcium antiporter [Planctomycetaceae bacterium]|nr:sodium:calcium antiporter [Planctomycetaceae bacterium]